MYFSSFNNFEACEGYCESKQFESYELKKEKKVSEEISEEYAQQHNGPNWYESLDWKG
jgi:hypothetical protein